METEIVFCERCGVSIPEHEVAVSRQASGGQNLCPTCLAPGHAGNGDLQLYFCENCRVSIAVSDVLTGTARPEGSGYLCAVCSQGTPAERVARRTAVEREMAASLAGTGAVVPATRPSAPLYFCDSCNASIPAPSVATGRALVEGGRTWCEVCRPRHARTGRTGGGFVPVLGAALLAAALTAAGFVAWDRLEKERLRESAAVVRVDPLDQIRRDVRAAREDAGVARGEVADRADRVERELDRRVVALRADIRAAREATQKAGAAAATTASERMGRIEGRMGDLEETLDEGLRSLARRVDGLAARADTAPLPVVPAAGEETGGTPPPGAGEEPAAAPSSAEDLFGHTVALLKDPAAESRFAAAIDLGKLGRKEAWPHLVEALRKDDDPFVRRACVRSLGELKAYEAFPALVEALSDGEEYVAKHASMVIKEMAGQDFGYKQNQAKGDRRKVADRARKWWNENRDRLAPGAE